MMLINKVGKYLLFFFLFSVSVFGQNWIKVAEASYGDILTAQFVDANTGWFAGRSGAIHFTSDGGNTSTPQNSRLTDDINKIFFINNTTGYAAGDNLSLIRTYDAGFNWDYVPIDTVLFGDASSEINSIYFLNDSTGWIVTGTSSSGYAGFTNDGGKSWEIQISTDEALYDISFSDSLHGVIVGYSDQYNYYTTDGGKTWTKSDPIIFGSTSYTSSQKKIYSVNMLNNNLAYAAGYGLDHPDPTRSKRTIILKSIDGGKTWTYLSESSNSNLYGSANSIWFENEESGYILTNEYIVKTSDGGQSWEHLPINYPSFMKNITGADGKIWLSGYEGLVSSSSNGGMNWNILTKVLNSDINKIAVVNENKVFAAGFKASIIESNDNGYSWMSRYLIADEAALSINDFQFINDNVVYAVHDRGLLSKSVDGGLNWQTFIDDTTTSSVKNNGLFFFDENNGFVVGKYGSNVDVIYKIKDGILLPDTTLNIAGKELYDINFINENIGLAVGMTMTLLRTEDGGDTWSKIQFNESIDTLARSLKTIAVQSNNDAFIIGGGMLLRSTDLGLNWQPVMLDSIFEDHTLNDIKFFRDSIGVIAGNVKIDGIDFGKTYLSMDYGSSWKDISDGNIFIDQKFNSVDISDSGKIWIAGNDGNIYTYQLDIPVSVAYENNSVDDFYLSQNYPNPFNPTTNIQFSLPQSGIVNLKIYDILGREVALLVNEFKQAGRHTVNFNAAGLSSGIYIYSLTHNGRSETKKMQLLK